MPGLGPRYCRTSLESFLDGTLTSWLVSSGGNSACRVISYVCTTVASSPPGNWEISATTWSTVLILRSEMEASGEMFLSTTLTSCSGQSPGCATVLKKSLQGPDLAAATNPIFQCSTVFSLASFGPPGESETLWAVALQ